jgi:hypothetical protein
MVLLEVFRINFLLAFSPVPLSCLPFYFSKVVFVIFPWRDHVISGSQHGIYNITGLHRFTTRIP